MPTPKVSAEDLQEAIDLVELHGSAHLAVKAGASKLSASTLYSRGEMARLRGFKPTVRKDTPRIYQRERLGRMHIVIPDVQCKSGVKLDHLTWVGKYIADKRPDAVICIGDFADLESLSKYDIGTLRGENKRLKRDLQTARDAMDMLMAPIRAVADYQPELHMTMGNHEERLARFANEHPYLEDVV
jgi:hypothetical protein